MPRSKKQLDALLRSKKNQVAKTKSAFRLALNRLAEGRPKYTDGRLTYDNLWKEAQLSRATLNREAYKEFKNELDALKHNKNRTVKSPDDIYSKNRELMELTKQLRAEKYELEKKYEKLMLASKQEIMILNRQIEKLQKSKRRIENGKVTRLRSVE